MKCVKCGKEKVWIMKLKVGDYVRVIKNISFHNDNKLNDFIGKIGKIRKIDNDYKYPIVLDIGIQAKEEELEKITNKQEIVAHEL
jgi:ribosomal protein L21E